MTRKQMTLSTSLLAILVVLLLVAGPVSAYPLVPADTVTFTGSELLGKPTDTSITINIIPDSDIEYYYEYGTVSGSLDQETSPIAATGGQPHEVVIMGLSPNTRYYYRMIYDGDGDVEDGDYEVRDEHTFHTQRAPGSTFKFTIISDSHAMYNTQYQQAMANIANEQPDFHFDLGDTFMVDGATSQTTVNNAYLAQREPAYMDGIGHSSPIFLASGNHENEEGWNLDDAFSIAQASIQARKLYFPTPIDEGPGGFYSGNTDPLPAIDEGIYGDEFREDYYAWEWGDALFVVFDPFQYTMTNPYGATAGEGGDDPASGDRWNWTLGLQQFNWLKQTLENSDAKYKFMFAHHMLGGTQNYVRGGAVPAHMFEWGGYNADGATWGFSTQRPTFGTEPIRQLMIDNGVSAFFHGHDHQYAYEVRDGIVYLSMPRPSTGLDFNYYSENDPYTERVLASPGHLRVTVAPTEATVDYVTSSGSSAAVQHSFTIEPNAPSTDPTISLSGTPLSAFRSEPGIPSAEQIYTVSGANLTDDITITPPADFEISLTSGSGWTTSPLVLTPTGGSVTEADIFVRFNRATEGISNGDITHASPGATPKDVAVSGTASSTVPVTLDGAVSSNTGNGVSSITINHTTGAGEDRLMLIGVSWNCGDTNQSVSSVTFTPDEGSATPLNLVTTQQAGTQLRYSAIYSLLNPPSGQAGTITITFSGSVSSGIVAGAANFAGVDQATPLGAPAGAGSDSNDDAPIVTITGLNGTELVFDNVFQGASGESQTLTPSVEQTERWTGFAGNTRASASTEQATGDSVTMSWTAASASYWAIAAVPINPAPVGTTFDLTMATDGNGATTPSAGVHTYTENTVVNISATPNSSYVFDSWTGDADCADGSVTMDADKSCTANFVQTPVDAITYIGSIGSEVSKTSGASLVVNTTAPVETGDDIIIAYATDPNANVPPISVTDSAGNTYSEVGLAVNTGQLRTYIFAAYDANALQAGSNITITASAAVAARVAVVSVFRGLKDEEPLDQTSTGTGSSATPSSGATATTTEVNELLVGAIGDEGPDGDAAGTWLNSFTPGPRLGTTGGTDDTNITISLGYRVVSSTGAYTAAKSGIASRDWAALIATFKAEPAPSAPRITLAGTPLSAFSSLPGVPSAEQTYTVSGSNLTDDITITAPNDFEISTTSGSDFGSALSLSQSNGSVAATTIYVRFNRATEGTSSGNITHTSPGATTRNVAVTGTATPLAPVAFSILLGRPTDQSVTANIIADTDAEFYVEYGDASGSYSEQTGTFTATADEPIEIVLDGLSTNDEYFYRIVYRQSGATGWNPGAEYAFDTQRAPGSAFTFTIISDSHLGQYGGQSEDELDLYKQTLSNVLADQPDFHIDDGDTFAMDPLPPYGEGLGNGMTEENAEAAYYLQRPYLDTIGASVPVFLAIGNHENEEGWNWDDVFDPPEQSLAIVGMRARKLYYPNPIPDDFYSGNTDSLPAEFVAAYPDLSTEEPHHEDYFAWTWGDALFVVLDPFHYSMTWPNEDGFGYGGEGQDGEVSGDRWDWTLGIDQYLWLKDTLENSDATYKFVLSHHVTGGSTSYGRGGISAAPYFEWGGLNADDTWGWDTERPAAAGWDVPIHQLFIDNDVDAYIHGHDHIYAYEVLDGIVYLEVPKPDDAGYDWEPYGYGYTEGLYPDAIEMIPNSGHIRVTVSPTEATFDYVRSYLPGDGANGEVAHSFTIYPACSTTPPQAVDVTIAQDGTDVVLNWTDAPENTGGYQIYRSTVPYFSPNETTKLGDPLPVGSTSFTDEGAAGTPGLSYFYVVQAMNCTGSLVAHSASVAVFIFALTPGDS